MIKALPIILFSALLSGCQTLNLSSQKLVSSQPKVTESGISTPETKLETCQSIAESTDPEAYSDVWERIGEQLTLKVPNNRRVRAQKSWYSNHPKYLARVSERANPYLYFIVNEIEQRGLPLELALLPIVESAFDPFAYSHGRASGMWQFIPGTGKGYGLSQNWWYDGRRDIFLSTHAALDYLSYLNKRFDGNWLYALAAYNSGQGNVSRAIRYNKKRGKPTDFWSLNLPKETKAYVPKLLALAQLISARTENKLPWTAIENQPYFTRVATNVQIDLSLAADLSEQSMSEFYQLNPAFNHWATPPKGPHYLLFPISKAFLFKKNLATIPLGERIAYKRYKIRKGDSLSGIADKYSTSISLLKSNNQLRNNGIREGQTLLIPVPSKQREKYSKSNQQRLLASQNRKHQGNKTTIKVSRGDSFWTLSRHYKVNIRSLASWNNMAPTDPLRIGKRLVIWTKQPVFKQAGLMNSKQRTKKIRYKVRHGDSFARIAGKFNVSLSKIRKWNRTLSRKKYLQPGQSLTLFVDITNQF